MNRSTKKLLKKLYSENSLLSSEVVKLVERKTDDYRDFYPLAALVEGDYLGFTGGQPDKDEPFRRTMLAQSFQCYRQGRGPQSCGMVTMFDSLDRDEVYFYVGPKTIELFESRRSDSKKLLASAGLSFFAAVVVAVITYWLRQGI
ncbi:hypothetical protein [Pseudomonas palmensis]|uniref:hypothetical protein n=1 Tax=Pseudomonas palmensis TaxID=2815362 RepID=UPI0039E73CBF